MDAYSHLEEAELKEPESHWRELKPMEFPPGNIAARSWSHKIIQDMHVMRSRSILENGEEWIHISVSRSDRLPSWVELVKIRDEFLGEMKEAYHVIPSKDDYVNVHRYCLHIWSPMNGKPCVANLQKLKWEYAL